MKKRILKGIFVLSLCGCVLSALVLSYFVLRYQKYEHSYDTVRHQATSESHQKNRKSTRFIDFATLRRENSDTVGWVSANNNKIDYPIVQTDDNKYYLKHLFNKEKGSAGCIFLDARNSADFSDPNSIIYGHNMRVGTMFGTLDNYQRPRYCAKHPNIILYTPQKTLNLKIVAAVTAPSEEIVSKLPLKSRAEMRSYAEWAQQHSTFKSRIQVKSTDHLVTFVTCAYSYSDARFILVCSY